MSKYLPLLRHIADDPPRLARYASHFALHYINNPYHMTQRYRFHLRYNLINSHDLPEESLMLTAKTLLAFAKATMDERNRGLPLAMFTLYARMTPLAALLGNADELDFASDIDVYNCIDGEFSDCDDHYECIDFARSMLGLLVCDDCTETFPEDDITNINGCYICDSCREESYTYSDYEDRYIHNDDVADAIDRDGDPCTIHRDNGNFHWCDHRDMYVHDDYESPDDEMSVRNIIHNYHSSRDRIESIHDTWTERNGYHMGAELEVEAYNVNRDEAAYRIHEIVNPSGEYGERMFFENDGSLNDGFEMITQPMSLPMMAKTFRFLENPDAIAGLRSHMTRTCGLHVHVSKRGLTNLQINKIVAFVNDPRHEWLIRAVARRYSTGFCNIKHKKMGSLHWRQDDRYEAINIQPRHTIEFRIFRGSLKYRSVMAALEFCHALVQFCRPAEAGIKDLTDEKFLTFCQNKMKNETKHLLGFLNNRLPNYKKVA